MTPDRRARWSSTAYRLFGVAALLVGWELLVAPHDPALELSAVGRTLATYLISEEVVTSILASVRRIGIGFGIGSAVGLAVGVTLGMSPRVQTIFEPIWGFLRPMSPLAWVPLSIVWFGISEEAAIFVIAYATFFPVMLNTAAGVNEVPDIFVDASRTLGAGRLDRVRFVLLPALVPYILAGLRISLGLSWAVIVAAELVIGSVLRAGVGYLMLRYTLVLFDLSRVMVLIIVVGVLALAVDRGMRALARRMTPWRAA